MITITIDGNPIETLAGRTILEVCREKRIHIPTLCYHPALIPYGACRLCMVEILQPPRPSRLAASCVTPCEDGMQILTQSPEVQKSRRMTAELLLAEDEFNPRLRKIADELGVTHVRYKINYQEGCILCGLCMRACRQIVGVGAINTIYRGFEKKISPPFQIESEICINCGTCVLVCPTDAIKFKDISGFARIRQERPVEVIPYANGGANGKDLVHKALRARQLRKKTDGSSI